MTDSAPASAAAAAASDCQVSKVRRNLKTSVESKQQYEVYRLLHLLRFLRCLQIILFALWRDVGTSLGLLKLLLELEDHLLRFCQRVFLKVYTCTGVNEKSKHACI